MRLDRPRSLDPVSIDFRYLADRHPLLNFDVTDTSQPHVKF